MRSVGKMRGSMLSHARPPPIAAVKASTTYFVRYTTVAGRIPWMTKSSSHPNVHVPEALRISRTARRI
jgi:hypothetical protein